MYAYRTPYLVAFMIVMAGVETGCEAVSTLR